MIEAYNANKDIYCAIAALAFDVDYEDCLEHFPDGTVNKEGKTRRATAKKIVLGILYGMSTSSIAADLKITKQKASAIYKKVMQSFPGLRNFIEESKEFAREYGYVETVWGRKRRLPNMLLDPYEFEYIGSKDKNFDPLDDEEDLGPDPELISYYTKRLNETWGFQAKNAIMQEALKDGLKIKDNTGLIAEAERQVINSQIQGSAADLTKIAMINVYNDKVLQDKGFRLLITVHDELMGEAPVENAKECGERLSQLMIEAGKDLAVPLKCDCDYMTAWGNIVDF